MIIFKSLTKVLTSSFLLSPMKVTLKRWCWKHIGIFSHWYVTLKKWHWYVTESDILIQLYPSPSMIILLGALLQNLSVLSLMNTRWEIKVKTPLTENAPSFDCVIDSRNDIAVRVVFVREELIANCSTPPPPTKVLSQLRSYELCSMLGISLSNVGMSLLWIYWSIKEEESTS